MDDFTKVMEDPGVDQKTAEVPWGEPTPSCNKQTAAEHTLSNYVETLDPASPGSFDAISPTILNVLALLSPNCVPTSLIINLCLKTPPCPWKAKIISVSEESVREIIDVLISRESLLNTGKGLQVSHEVREQVFTQLNSSASTPLFLQWFLWEFSLKLAPQTEHHTLLPALLENLMLFPSDESILKFLFYVHESGMNLMETSSCFRNICKKLRDGELDFWEKKDFIAKLAPFFSFDDQSCLTHQNESSSTYINEESLEDVTQEDVFSKSIAGKQLKRLQKAASQDATTSNSIYNSVRSYNLKFTDIPEPFADQSNIIDEISAYLLDKTPSSSNQPRILVIYGLPKSGKTVLLKKYICISTVAPATLVKTAAEPRNILWLNAQSADLLVRQLEDMCMAMLCFKSELNSRAEVQHQISVLYNQLLSQPTWIVLDGANETGESNICSGLDFIPASISSSSSAVIFITTQNANCWSNLAKRGAKFLRVSKLVPEASADYVHRRLITMGRMSHAKSINDLASHMEHFPWALKVACDLIEDEETADQRLGNNDDFVEGFLQDLENLEASERYTNLIDSPVTPGEKFIRTMQQLWLDWTPEHSAIAQDGMAVLDVLSLLSAPVPPLWVHQAIRNQMERQDTRYFQRVLSYLQLCSLLETDSGKEIRVLRLVLQRRVFELAGRRSNMLNQAIGTTFQILENCIPSNLDFVEEVIKKLKLTFVKLYQQKMLNVKDFSSFEDVHLKTLKDLKSTATAYQFEQLDKGSRKVCWESFLKSLAIAKKEAKTALQARFQKFESEDSKLYLQLINFYKSETNPFFAQKIPVSVKAMTKLHETTKTDVLKKLKAQEALLTSSWNWTDEEKTARINRFKQELQGIKDEAFKANESRWEVLKSEVEVIKENLVDEYSENVIKLAQSLRTEVEWETGQDNEREKVLKKLKSWLEVRVQDREYIKEVTTELEKLLDFEKTGCLDVFRNHLREQNLQHMAGMLEANKFYKAEMDLKFTSKPWWNDQELTKVHQDLLQRALESCKDKVALTPKVEQDLEKSFAVILQGYLELNKAKSPNREPVIGIDLGTTYCCVGVFNDGAVRLIPNDFCDGKSTIASYIAFDDSGAVLFGNEAKAKASQNLLNTVFDAKRLIGRSFNDPTVQKDISRWPFKVIEVNNEPRIKIKEQLYRPEEISAKLLAYLKEVAEKYLQRTVKKAVITVPAYFSGAQRKATKDAADIAGLEATIINEPTAAALAYNLDRTGEARKNVLVFDLGGGTFDVAVISMDFGELKVLSVKGDTHLGGEDFDEAMVDALVERVLGKYGIDLARGRDSTDIAEKMEAFKRLRRIKSVCEERKRFFSQANRVEIKIDKLDGDFSLEENFTRNQFNRINGDKFKQCISIVEEALEDAKLEKQDVHDIVLVGGSTRIPKVQELLKEFFGEEQRFIRSINADEAVAHGAAFKAALIGDQVKDPRRRMTILDVTPHSLGIQLEDGRFSAVIGKNTFVSCTKTNESYCTVHDNQTEDFIDISVSTRKKLLGTKIKCETSNLHEETEIATPEMTVLNLTAEADNLEPVQAADTDTESGASQPDFSHMLENLKISDPKEADEKPNYREKELLEIKTEVVSNYIQETQSLMTSDMPLNNILLEAKHQSCKNEAVKMAHQKLRRLTTGYDRTEVIQSIENAIEEKYQELIASNSAKWQQLEQALDLKSNKVLQAYRTEMNAIAENMVDKKGFEAAEQLLRDTALDDFEKELHSRTEDPAFIAKMEEAMLSRLKTEKNGYWNVFLGRLKMDAVYVEIALLKSKETYTEEMEKGFISKAWLEPQDLKQLHNEISTKAIESTLKNLTSTLSPVQRKQLEDAFEHMYLKYKARNDRRNPGNEPAIGIDLGTTYSCVGVCIGDKVEIIHDFQGSHNSTIPSSVVFNAEGTIDVGEVAEANAHRYPHETVFDVKRLIGRKFADPEVRKDRELWPFEVVDYLGEPRIEVRERKYRPEVISAKVLSKMKYLAETHLRRKVVNAVVTVPAYFGDAQRKATQDAAEIAGLNATILNEPTGAAICYELQFSGAEEQNVLIFDLGGGTLDVSVLSMLRGTKKFKVKAIGGDTHLGGRDFDRNMMTALVERVKRRTDGKTDLAKGIDSTNKAERLKALSRLRPLLRACESRKRILSMSTRTDVIVESLEGNYFEEEFTRQEFEDVNKELFIKCIKVVERTLKDAKMDKKDINDIVLVGGSTRIPKVQELLSDFFNGKSPNNSINPDEAVAYGAALHAALIFQKLPDDKQKKEKIKDVTPYSLGVEVFRAGETDGVMQVIIEGNSEIPITRVIGGLTTFCDDQTECDIDIYQGQDFYVKGNTLLGQFKLTGIPAAPAGQERIECSMTIDEQGVLNVEARVVTNGKSEKLQVQVFGGMTAHEKELEKEGNAFRWKSITEVTMLENASGLKPDTPHIYQDRHQEQPKLSAEPIALLPNSGTLGDSEVKPFTKSSIQQLRAFFKNLASNLNTASEKIKSPAISDTTSAFHQLQKLIQNCGPLQSSSEVFTDSNSLSGDSWVFSNACQLIINNYFATPLYLDQDKLAAFHEAVKTSFGNQISDHKFDNVRLFQIAELVVSSILSSISAKFTAIIRSKTLLSEALCTSVSNSYHTMMQKVTAERIFSDTELKHLHSSATKAVLEHLEEHKHDLWKLESDKLRTRMEGDFELVRLQNDKNLRKLRKVTVTAFKACQLEFDRMFVRKPEFTSMADLKSHANSCRLAALKNAEEIKPNSVEYAHIKEMLRRYAFATMLRCASSSCDRASEVLADKCEVTVILEDGQLVALNVTAEDVDPIRLDPRMWLINMKPCIAEIRFAASTRKVYEQHPWPRMEDTAVEEHRFLGHLPSIPIQGYTDEITAYFSQVKEYLLTNYHLLPITATVEGQPHSLHLERIESVIRLALFPEAAVPMKARDNSEHNLDGDVETQTQASFGELDKLSILEMIPIRLPNILFESSVKQNSGKSFFATRFHQEQLDEAHQDEINSISDSVVEEVGTGIVKTSKGSSKYQPTDLPTSGFWANASDYSVEMGSADAED